MAGTSDPLIVLDQIAVFVVNRISDHELCKEDVMAHLIPVCGAGTTIRWFLSFADVSNSESGDSGDVDKLI